MFGVNTTYNKPSGLLDHNGRPFPVRPGLDRDFPLSPVSQFAGVYGSGSNVLYNLFDQALLEDREDAVRRMMNDPHISAPLQERTKAVESLPWEIECDDDRDPTQKAMKDGITKVVRATSRMRKMVRYMHKWGVFKGRQGAAVAYSGDKFKGGWGAPPGPAFMNLTDLRNPDGLEKRKVPILRKHSPVDGDKIQWMFDGTPVILGNPTDLASIPGAEIANTTLGRGLVVRGPEWESRYIIHQHEMEDADYFSPREAGKAFGVGLRDSLYWTWWLKNRWLANITQFMQRFGLGVRAWLYEAGSDAARQEAEKAAASLDENSVDIMVPVWREGGQRALEGIKFIDVGSGGTGVLRELIDYLDDSMERLIIGQTLSSDTEGSGLGGAGVAMLHASTKSKIIAADANDLGETFTSQWIRRLPVWIWGEDYRSLSDAFRFKFIVDTPNPTESLTAAATFVQLGGEVSEPALRRSAGLPEPKPGEKVISTLNLAREQAQLAQQVQANPGEPTPPIPGEEQQGPTAADFEALLSGQGSSGQEADAVDQFSRGNLERFARTDDPMALGQPPTTPVAGPGMKPRVGLGHGQTNPEFVNGKPHTTGEFEGKTPIADATPLPAKPKLTPTAGAPPVPPVTPDLVATFAKKFQAKYGPKSMAVLRQKAQTAQGGVKLAAQALMQHMQGDTQPDASTFDQVMKGFKPAVERHERTDLEQYAEGAPRPPKPPMPKSPVAPAPKSTGAPGRIDAGPPNPGRLSSVVPKIAGSSVLPKILSGPLVDRARAQAVAKTEAGAAAPRNPDIKSPVMRPEVERHAKALRMNAPEAKSYLDQKIAQYESFAHESPAAMKLWKGANILKAALSHAEGGQYDPKHVAEATKKFQGMTADPDMGIVPKPAAPKPSAEPPTPETKPSAPPEPPDWMHNGLFATGEPGDEKGPRQPWESDPEAWRGDPEPPFDRAKAHEKAQEIRGRLDKLQNEIGASDAARHFTPTENKPAVSFNVPDDFAGELLAKDLDHRPPMDLPPQVSRQIAAELRSGETSAAKLFDDQYAIQRWGRTFGPANFPDLAKMFRGEKQDEGGVDFETDEEPAKPTAPVAQPVDPKTSEIANKLNAQYGDKATGMLQQKLAAWKADPQAAAKAARAEAVIRELERRKTESAKGVDFQLEDDDGAGPNGHDIRAQTEEGGTYVDRASAQLSSFHPEALRSASDWVDKHRANLKPELHAFYRDTMASVLTKFSEPMRKMAIDSVGKGRQFFYNTLSEVSQAASKITNRNERGILGFVEDKGDKVDLHLDGGSENGRSPERTSGTYAHELGHAIDVGDKYSGSDEWRKAYRADVLRGKNFISRLALKSPLEGFAEFVRFMHDRGNDHAKTNFPRLHQFFEAKGLI